MGTFFGRGARFDHRAIAEAMRPATYAMFNARIQIFDPTLDTPAGPFDPATDTRTPAVIAAPIYDSGVYGAELQPIRSPTPVQYGNQTTFILGIRFQAKRPDPEVVLRAGLRIKVIDGGNAPEMEAHDYTLNEGANTSLAWGHILEASTVTTGVRADQ